MTLLRKIDSLATRSAVLYMAAHDAFRWPITDRRCARDRSGGREIYQPENTGLAPSPKELISCSNPSVSLVILNPNLGSKVACSFGQFALVPLDQNELHTNFPHRLLVLQNLGSIWRVYLAIRHMIKTTNANFRYRTSLRRRQTIRRSKINSPAIPSHSTL